jgi:hypothetical protein
MLIPDRNRNYLRKNQYGIFSFVLICILKVLNPFSISLLFFFIFNIDESYSTACIILMILSVIFTTIASHFFDILVFCFPDYINTPCQIWTISFPELFSLLSILAFVSSEVIPKIGNKNIQVVLLFYNSIFFAFKGIFQLLYLPEVSIQQCSTFTGFYFLEFFLTIEILFLSVDLLSIDRFAMITYSSVIPIFLLAKILISKRLNDFKNLA